MTPIRLWVLTILAALGSGLVAGILFAFSTFVMKALGRTAPETGIAVMQSINVAMLNPRFFSAFFGTGFLCIGLAAFVWLDWGAPGRVVLLVAATLYVVGTILVTAVFNVPLNNALAATDAGSAAGADLRTRYLSTWTFRNHVRTAPASFTDSRASQERMKREAWSLTVRG